MLYFWPTHSILTMLYSGPMHSIHTMLYSWLVHSISYVVFLTRTLYKPCCIIDPHTLYTVVFLIPALYAILYSWATDFICHVVFLSSTLYTSCWTPDQHTLHAILYSLPAHSIHHAVHTPNFCLLCNCGDNIGIVLFLCALYTCIFHTIDQSVYYLLSTVTCC